MMNQSLTLTQKLKQETGMLWSLWFRELLRFLKERSRWIGVIVQPLLFWVFIGIGMKDVFQMPGASGVSYITFFFPGVLVMTLLFTSIFATMSIIEDRQSGFLQAVLVAPGSRLSMVMGKLAGVATMACVQIALMIVFAPFANYAISQIQFHYLIGIVLVGTVGITAMNFMVAWVLNSTQGYHVVMSIVLFPMWILSGSVFPLSETWMKVVMLINPMTYLVAGIRFALDAHAATTAPWPSWPLCFGVLSVFAVVMLGGAWMVCRRGES